MYCFSDEVDMFIVFEVPEGRHRLVGTGNLPNTLVCVLGLVDHDDDEYAFNRVGD